MTKKEPKDKRIEAIITAALDEFLEQGYDRASMEAIALRAGISKGGIYHHFKSKDEVLLYANQKLNDPIREMMQKASQKPTAVQGLSWYIRSYLNYWLKHEKEVVFMMLSMIKMLDSPRLWEMYAAYTKSYIAFFQGLFERGIAGGEFSPHSAFASAVTLMGALDGILAYLIMDMDLHLNTIVEIFNERFVHAYRVKSTPNRKRRS